MMFGRGGHYLQRAYGVLWDTNNVCLGFRRINLFPCHVFSRGLSQSLLIVPNDFLGLIDLSSLH